MGYFSLLLQEYASSSCNYSILSQFLFLCDDLFDLLLCVLSQFWCFNRLSISAGFLYQPMIFCHIHWCHQIANCLTWNDTLIFFISSIIILFISWLISSCELPWLLDCCASESTLLNCFWLSVCPSLRRLATQSLRKCSSVLSAFLHKVRES